jgi:uncharacterized protein (TIGR03083 family)
MPNMPADVSYLGTIRNDAAGLATAARAAGLGADVPTCPEWDVEKLVRHTGRVFTSCAAVVRERGPVDFGALAQMPKGDGAIEAFEERATALVDALEGLPEDFPIWNWFGIEPPIPGFYHRRMAHEVAIHRYDAQSAAGACSPVDTVLAVDGLDEFLAFLLAAREPTGSLGGSLHLHAIDTDAEWVVRDAEGGRLVATKGHERCDVAVRGTASDLNLFVVNRVAASTLDVVGDPSIAERWRDVVSF